MIPKIIHYCWFGGAGMPEEFQQYIASWHELHPGWEIRRWDENNFPLDNDYVKKAIGNKNWSNVSNYGRLYCLEKEGGIYMDIDFKLVKPLDELLDNDLFCGFESGSESEFWVNNALMGAVSGLPLLQKAIEKFISTFDGLELSNLSGPQFMTKFLKEELPDITYGDYKKNGIRIYAKEYFYTIIYNE
jgi:mannosyltransferase OCH1-like enzyme